MPVELDEDMLDLLGQLDAVAEEPQPEELDLKPSNVVLTPIETLVPTDCRSVDDHQISKPSTTVETPGISISKYLTRLDEVTDSVLSACAADRKEAQDVINLYRGAIQDSADNGEVPSRMWVDGLVKAVEVKASINNTAVKAMEATAKMLAATKSGIQINQQFNNPANLTDILDEALTDEDEY